MSVLSAWLEGRTSASEAWDQTLGKHGLGDWLSGGAVSEKDALIKRSKGFVQSGISDLQDYGQSMLGSDGFLQQQEESKIKALGMNVGNQLSKIDNYANTVAMKGNMATGVDLTTRSEQSLIDNYKLSLGDINMESQKSQIDFIQDLKKQKTQLLMDYSTATGDAYKGSVSGDFDDFIDQYS
jgi:hypothetical protein